AGGWRGGAGLADRLADLHDLLAQRRELLVTSQLAAHLLHLTGRKLAAPRAVASHGPGPQIARAMPPVTRLGANTIRLAAAPVVLANTAPPKIPHRGQPLKQLGTAGPPPSQQRTGHRTSSVWLFDPQPDYAAASPNSDHLHPCPTPLAGVAAGAGRPGPRRVRAGRGSGEPAADRAGRSGDAGPKACRSAVP